MYTSHALVSAFLAVIGPGRWRHSALATRPADSWKPERSILRRMCWQTPVALIHPIATVVDATYVELPGGNPTTGPGTFLANTMYLRQPGGRENA
jgi:hypothetical protein